LLQVTNLNAGYEKTPILTDINLEIRTNEIVAIIGSNGAGKSTLAKAISGMIPCDGEILYKDIRIDGLKPHLIVKNGIAHVPEGRKLFPTMTVRDNLEIGAYTQKSESVRKETLDFVFELFPRLAERQSQKAGTLSGGEQQMLAIGRGLMSRPGLLILDEPTLGIMPKLVSSIMNVIVELRTMGITVLLIEQNVKRTLEIADRAYVLQTGRIVAEGRSFQLLTSTVIQDAYLGKSKTLS